MEIKVNGEFIPRNTDFSKYYTPLCRVKLTAEGQPMNGLKGMFHIRVFRLTTDQMVSKDYMCYLGMASNTNQTAKIQIFDKTPEVSLVYVVGQIEGEYCVIYAKGGNSYDSIACQILYAPHKGFIEILPHVDTPVENIITPISPSYYSPTITFNTGWSATSSKQRQIYALNSRVKLDYFISTTNALYNVTDYKIADLSVRAKYSKNIYCNWIKTDGSASGICELQITSASGGSTIICKTNVPLSSYIQLDCDYEIYGV